jgi:rare lipoprotein A (peptidoglycan hydrolase)
MSTGGRRAVLAVLSGGAMLGVPLLLLQDAAPQPSTPGGALGPHAVAAASAPAGTGGRTPSWELTRFRDADATTTTSVTVDPVTATTVPTSPTTSTTTTTTTAPPARTTTPPTTAPVQQVARTVAQPAAAPPAAAVAADSEVGAATWYGAASPGSCASPSLPFGTVLTVTNVATGSRTTCVVDDREADNPGRVVDMSPSGFSQIAALSEGVVTVSVSW